MRSTPRRRLSNSSAPRWLVDDQLFEAPAPVVGDKKCRRAGLAGSRQAVAYGVPEGLAEREYHGQRLDDLARLAAGAEDPVAVSELGQRTAEILQPLRGQGEKVGAIVAEALDVPDRAGPLDLTERRVDDEQLLSRD